MVLPIWLTPWGGKFICFVQNWLNIAILSSNLLLHCTALAFSPHNFAGPEFYNDFSGYQDDYNKNNDNDNDSDNDNDNNNNDNNYKTTTTITTTTILIIIIITTMMMMMMMMMTMMIIMIIMMMIMIIIMSLFYSANFKQHQVAMLKSTYNIRYQLTPDKMHTIW